VNVSYTDLAEQSRSVGAFGDEDVNLDVFDAAADYHALHQVHFDFCDCSSPTYTTTPK
jgi:hypothetical protein